VQVFISTDAGGTGLNLQAATALINLDMPWNPAILDQRIARIHRLGQKQKVQIFILLAEDSYEQRVAQLVKGKRDLFDNVIDPAATEDAVGVSKKMLQTLMEDLAGASVDEDAAAVPKGEAIKDERAEMDEAVVSVKVESAGLSDDEKTARQVVEAIQAAFGSRIERMLAKSGGLLVVVEHWQDDDEQMGQDLSVQGLPVAVIDGRTWRSLLRLGKASPLAEAETIFETVVTEQPQENPLSVLAQQKLHSAKVLIEQQCTAGVMDLLASALLLKLAALTEQTQPPVVTDAAVWIYGELLPKGLLTPEHAAQIMQVVSLSLGSGLPETLILRALSDVEQLFMAMA
jgi:Superfamily II DNA/RNA helicases, SNF2 family